MSYTLIALIRYVAQLKDPMDGAHEAMSLVCKRFCPHCHCNEGYTKGDGCNKIPCKCGKNSCYLCGARLDDKKHIHTLRNQLENLRAVEQLDQTKRHEAGCRVLVEAGITDETRILSTLASPPKRCHLPTE